MVSIPWPRTLLWRTFLLIVALIFLSLVAWFQIYNHYALRPRADQAAQTVVSVVNLTRAALIASDESQRLALLVDLNSLEGIQVFPAEPDDPLVALADSESMHLLQELVRKKLGAYTRFSGEMHGESGYFVSFRLDDDTPDDEYWVGMPPEKLGQAGVAGWLGWGVAAAAMSLAGAYLLVFGITRPLKSLERAARMIGQGERIDPLSEHGPREIAAVAQAFNQMNHDLAQLESDRALILAGISHDLRTPLARLRLGIEMSGAVPEDLEAMGNDIEEMDRIIKQFLDFARDAHAEPISTTDVSALLRQIGESSSRRGAQLNMQIQDGIAAKVRPLALRRAVTNLVDNARRYGNTSAGIDLALHREAKCAIISVADYGPGIPANEVERLKRPFTRLETARTDAEGSGLGLAIVDRIARMHGGSFDLLNRDGGGLEAIIRVPMD